MVTIARFARRDHLMGAHVVVASHAALPRSPLLHVNPRGPRTMSTLTRLARSFVRDEQGATTAEYGIIIVVVAGIAIFVLSQLNGALSTLYGNFNSKVSTVT